MEEQNYALFSLVVCALLAYQSQGLIPYLHNVIWDIIIPYDDPFKIIEHTPLTVPKSLDTVALARADWQETEQAHIISIDIPGIKKEDMKIEVEENSVLRISGERERVRKRRKERNGIVQRGLVENPQEWIILVHQIRVYSLQNPVTAYAYRSSTKCGHE